MVVVDVLISKTFDACVICPAEQTAIIDDEIYDAVVAEFERMGAQVLAPGRGRPGRRVRVRWCDKVVNLRRSASRPPCWTARRARRTATHDKMLMAPLPSDLDELAAHPLVHEKLMPVLGLVKARERRATPSMPAVLVTETAAWATHRRSTPATRTPSRRYSNAVRTGRILVNAPTAVGALGGVYNSLTPTFSLGCGTWGGSLTTENVNYHHLLNIKMVSHRRTPPQWFRVRGDIYFNSGALENLRELDAAPGRHRHRRR